MTIRKGSTIIAGSVDLTNEMGLKADLNSPHFTGSPTAPTLPVGIANNQLATTKFVSDSLAGGGLPSQSGNAGKFLTTNGVDAEWVAKDDYYQSLNDTQAAHLDSSVNPTADGEYEGKTVPNNTVFVRDNGKIQKYSYTAQTGGYDSPFTLPRPTNGGTWFNNSILVGCMGGDDPWGIYKSSDRGSSFTSVASSKISSFLKNSSVCIGYDYWEGSYLISSDGATWSSFDPSTVGVAAPFFAKPLTFGETLILFSYYAITPGWSGYVYSEDDASTWTFKDYTTILQDSSESVQSMLVAGNKLYLYTSLNGADTHFEYVYISTDGKTWSARQNVPFAANHTGLLRSAGDKIFLFNSWSYSAWYSTDGINFTETTSGVPYVYEVPNIVYCEDSEVYVALYHDEALYCTSSDGISWSSTSTPDRVDLSHPYIVGDNFVFVKIVDLPWIRINTEATYTRSLTDLNGVGTGSSAPTTSTVGYVGKLYVTDGGAVYICTGVTGSTYTWVQITTS